MSTKSASGEAITFRLIGIRRPGFRGQNNTQSIFTGFDAYPLLVEIDYGAHDAEHQAAALGFGAQQSKLSGRKGFLTNPLWLCEDASIQNQEPNALWLCPS